MDDLIRPVIVAPMAGGPSTPALVNAAGHAGAVGFLAAGYKSPDAVESEIRAITGVPYGLNIFVPLPPPPDVPAIERYRELLEPEAERYWVDLPPIRLHDDDHFAAKVELAEVYRVPLVSFTFGVPEKAVVERLRARGSRVLLTVTSPDEARRAAAVGPDALIAQAGAAGGHSATTDPAAYRGDHPATEILRNAELPIVVAGGTMTPADVQRHRQAGATAVQCGTAFLLADEAGTRPAQRDAVLSGDYVETVVTRAFTGHPARALVNRFTRAYSASAPIGYPAVHHLTAPIRAAAAERSDAGALNLWAGTGHASARPGSAADLVGHLMPGR